MSSARVQTPRVSQRVFFQRVERVGISLVSRRKSALVRKGLTFTVLLFNFTVLVPLQPRRRDDNDDGTRGKGLATALLLQLGRLGIIFTDEKKGRYILEKGRCKISFAVYSRTFSGTRARFIIFNGRGKARFFLAGVHRSTSLTLLLDSTGDGVEIFQDVGKN